MKIPLFKPPLGQDELKALKKTFESGWVGLGPNTYKFEEEFRKYIGCEYALGVNSATAALQLCLEYFGIKSKISLAFFIETKESSQAVSYTHLYNGEIFSVSNILRINITILDGVGKIQLIIERFGEQLVAVLEMQYQESGLEQRFF